MNDVSSSNATSWRGRVTARHESNSSGRGADPSDPTRADPQAVLQMGFDADDSDAARAALQERFDIDELQATALMDAQFRRATRRDREKIEHSRTELLDHLRYLDDLRDR